MTKAVQESKLRFDTETNQHYDELQVCENWLKAAGAASSVLDIIVTS